MFSNIGLGNMEWTAHVRARSLQMETDVAAAAERERAEQIKAYAQAVGHIAVEEPVTTRLHVAAVQEAVTL